MTRSDDQRLNDIVVAIEAIRQHVSRGGLSDGLVFDAVRMRLLEIGEAVKALPSGLLAKFPGVPWEDVAQMRDLLAHRYFDTEHAIVEGTVEHNLAALETAVRHLLQDNG